MSEAGLALSRLHESAGRRVALVLLMAIVLTLVGGGMPAASAATQGSGHAAGGEANLKVPDLGQVSFAGINGRTLLLWASWFACWDFCSAWRSSSSSGISPSTSRCARSPS